MIFNKFPREVGAPRKLVNNMKEFLDYVNVHNGKKKAVYTTIYMFKDIHSDGYKPEYDTAEVDKIFFDFDYKDCDSYQAAKTLHDYCKTKDLKHSIVMSGRGYHCYIYTKIQSLQFKKDAIKGGQMYFINKLGVVCDKQVIGDVCRLTRVPNTYNIKAGRFCIPLTEKQFNLGDEMIRTNAERQNF